MKDFIVKVKLDHELVSNNFNSFFIQLKQKGFVKF